MKIVIAPDSFKENLTSLEVASEIETGLKRVWPDAVYVKVPMADGGEGTVQSLVDATGGQIVKTEVSGPMGVKVMASYGLLGDGKTAVIEMAEASGLPLVPKDQRNPLVATTYGTGELIADAIKRGVEEIILGIGGSATNDAGAGLAQALGVRFLNFGGAPIRDLISGGDLDDVQAVDMSTVNPGLAKIHISVACDVTNPLCGEKGASRVYGPQKGATPEMVERLDKNLAHFAHIIKRSIGADVIDRPGAGAGGGIGAGLMAFTNATLKRGVELVVAATRLEDHHARRRLSPSPARGASTSRPRSARRLRVSPRRRASTACRSWPLAAVLPMTQAACSRTASTGWSRRRPTPCRSTWRSRSRGSICKTPPSAPPA